MTKDGTNLVDGIGNAYNICAVYLDFDGIVSFSEFIGCCAIKDFSLIGLVVAASFAALRSWGVGFWAKAMANAK